MNCVWGDFTLSELSTRCRSGSRVLEEGGHILNQLSVIILKILNAFLQFTVILMHARVWKHAPKIFCNLAAVRINYFSKQG